MCGLVGGLLREARDPKRLDRALETLHHRGPDAVGKWVSRDGRWFLGHTRLSIIGLDNGDQPIANAAGDVQLVVNGEFYGYRAIRERLRAEGCVFATESDSEIALHLYLREGMNLGRHLRGEFAAVIADRRNAAMLAIRDRFGIKPLFYAVHLREAGRSTLPYLAAFNIAAILGTAIWGRLSETGLGRRGAVTIAITIGMASLPLYLHADDPVLMILGALMMGGFGMGIWGTAPAYTGERFPTSARGVGPGFCYHTGAAIGSVMPFLIGTLQDRGIPLADAMTGTMLISGCLSAGLIWLGPETRGRSFTADEG